MASYAEESALFDKFLNEAKSKNKLLSTKMSPTIFSELCMKEAIINYFNATVKSYFETKGKTNGKERN